MLRLQLNASFGDFLLNVDTEICLDSATAIIGPNGSGKTTFLRSLAGLTKANGQIALGENVWMDSHSKTYMPVHKRPIGYMSQSPVLLPHLSVRSNLRLASFLAKRKSMKGKGIPIDSVVDSLNVRDLLDRKPHTLSGGETSRIALAQALLSNPKLLMLDEPLASVDVDRKAEFVPYLKSVHREYRIPMLYVTHSLSEVAALCEHTVVLRNGQIHKQGETTKVLQALQESPEIVGEFDAGTVLSGRIVRHDERFLLTYISSCNQELIVPTQDSMEVGDEVRLRIRARDISVATARPTQISIRNILKGEVLHVVSDNDTPNCEVHVKCGNEVIRALVTRASVVDLRIEAGNQVFALVKSVTIEY
ncbi:MAG: molybdenum ABC transporter ATP-binding protein [Gammaproteobacteria bacterium]|nr:molybdenum ABC transporter ATP-binding protein [Gammaproteobacteria bacterium]